MIAFFFVSLSGSDEEEETRAPGGGSVHRLVGECRVVESSDRLR